MAFEMFLVVDIGHFSAKRCFTFTITVKMFFI